MCPTSDKFSSPLVMTCSLSLMVCFLGSEQWLGERKIRHYDVRHDAIAAGLREMTY
jgi:hypothetical protein